MKVYIARHKEDLAHDLEYFTPHESQWNDPELAAQDAAKKYSSDKSRSFDELFAICIADDGTQTRVTVTGEPSWEYSAREGW